MMRFLSFIALGISALFAGVAGAQSLPSGASTSLSVVNMSQGNADATTVVAQPGDVLRYSLKLTSATADVKDYIAQFDVSGLLSTGAVLIDTQNATRSGNMLTYPAYSGQAPCEQEFVFVARVKDCGDAGMTVTAAGHSVTVDGAMCSEEPPVLTTVGPGMHWFVVGVLVLFGLLCIAVVPRRKAS
ncbi:hypothetical protein H6771_00940 [Candidatus Peribacteria bacterium]|nr:hypothetical protein [Candidatus Peribacteria bacterium]